MQLNLLENHRSVLTQRSVSLSKQIPLIKLVKANKSNTGRSTKKKLPKPPEILEIKTDEEKFVPDPLPQVRF